MTRCIATSRQKIKRKINLSPMTIMKQFLFALLLLPFFASSQTVDSLNLGFPIKGGKVVYESIADVKGIKKEMLYAASKKWISDSFTHSKAVTESEDIETGQIIGKGTANVTTKSNSWMLAGYLYKLEFNIQINCKDDKYRIRIYDITTNTSAAGGLISSDVKTPLETFAYYAPTKPLKTKQIERIKTSKEAINNVFTLLLENFNNSVNTYNQDTF
jgi:hypothetical protein